MDLIKKYSPKTIDEFLKYQPVLAVKNFIFSGEIPNLIIFGPPGSGKKTLARILAKETVGLENFVVWNASIYGGFLIAKSTSEYKYNEKQLAARLGIISLKDLAETKALTAKFKIIAINESEYLEKLTQQAFRVLLEKTHYNARYVFITDHIDSLIDPIKSRCLIIRLKAITLENFTKLINVIAQKENFSIDSRAVAYLYSLFHGNLRNSLLLLNKLLKNKVKVITSQEIKKFYDMLKDKELEQFLFYIKAKDFKKVRDSLIQLKERFSNEKLFYVLMDFISLELNDLDLYLDLAEAEHLSKTEDHFVLLRFIWQIMSKLP